jgi:tetrahydromethanopterin S-methyltransferase subunit G
MGAVPGNLRGKWMQSAQPRDIGILIFVIGLFLILFVVTLTMGTPVR